MIEALNPIERELHRLGVLPGEGAYGEARWSVAPTDRPGVVEIGDGQESAEIYEEDLVAALEDLEEGDENLFEEIWNCIQSCLIDED